MVGGGSGLARPGAVSRAHRGVLFLDECAEIGVSVLEALRTPLEDGEIRLARRDGVARYPARFQLVLAANPCPCAPADPRDCICPAAVKRRYLGKLSGPLLDRVDLRVEMHAVRAGAFAQQEGESSAACASASPRRVTRPRSAGGRTASAPTPRSAAPCCARSFGSPRRSMEPLRIALDRGLLSIRGVDRTLRVAWTLGRLGGTSIAGVRGRHHGVEFPTGRSAPMTDEIARAWAYLSRVAEPPCPELRALARRVGPVEAAERVRTGNVDGPIAQRTEARRQIDRAAEDLDVLTRLGGRLVTADDDEWPLLAFRSFGGVADRLRPQAHEPLVLWAVGPARLDAVADRAAAIVGTRAATAYGEYVAADLAAGLATRDAVVVSGRRVRHRWGCAPCRAGGRRVDGRGARRWRRCALPGSARRTAAAHL